MQMAERALEKRATGIPGLDAATGGGLPVAGAVLVSGGSGCGKTVLALQILARALERGDGAVFVSFEESAEQVRRDAASFQWGPALLASGRWTLIDGRPPVNADVAGTFDLEGLIAGMGASLERIDGSWLVLDGIDHLLELLPDEVTRANQIRRLHEWCEERGTTLLLTGKTDRPGGGESMHVAGIEYILPTILCLSAELAAHRLNRRFRVAKYRGSGHVTDELPLVMTAEGIQLPYSEMPAEMPVAASRERVSTGVARLDEVLGGGLYRGATTLISGAPGTAKTTLAASMAAAAAGRGERVLYLSFDELGDRIVRNMESVGISLAPLRDAGHLFVESHEAWSALAEEHHVQILQRIDAVAPDWLIIDPVSALLKIAEPADAHSSTEHLLAIARSRGVTTILTSLLETGSDRLEATLSNVSTLADNWISLSYRVLCGERNRALSVVKSRGSAHSNQVRELLLSSDGVDLADVYEYGSEVLMGTARVQKENEEAAARRRVQTEREQRRRDLERDLEQARMRMKQAESETQRLAEELELEQRAAAEFDREAHTQREGVRRQRGRAPRDDGDQGGRK